MLLFGGSDQTGYSLEGNAVMEGAGQQKRGLGVDFK